MNEQPASSRAVIYIGYMRDGEFNIDVFKTTLSEQHIKKFEEGADRTIKKAYGKKKVEKAFRYGIFAQTVGEFVLMLNQQQGVLGKDPELVRVAFLDGPYAGAVCSRTDRVVPEDVRARNEPDISLEPIITSDDKVH